MWNKLLEYGKQILTITNDMKQSKEDIKSLREDVKLINQRLDRISNLMERFAYETVKDR